MGSPYQQGQLDGLCGVYALVNAVDYLCGPLSTKEAQQLFFAILKHLEDKPPLARRCCDGLVINDLAGVLNSVVCKHYPIKRYKPFHRQPGIDKTRYLQSLQTFLHQPNTLVLLALEGYYSHWTLIHRITDKTLRTYDSSGMRYVLKSSCSMVSDLPKKRHWLLPTHTYVLMRR